MFKKLSGGAASVLAALSAIFLSNSCDFESAFPPDSGDGTIEVHFVEDYQVGSKASLWQQLDTNQFILTVTDASGKSVYHGAFSKAPQRLLVNAGTYTVSAVSSEFKAPLFDSPVFGDSKVVVVKAGESVGVTLDCAQTNAGIRLAVDSAFLEEYPSSVLLLRSADGQLLYSYSERRIAYFLPGAVSLVLSTGSTEKILFTRTLAAREILTLNIYVAESAAESTRAGISIQLDTVRFWENDSYTIGEASSDRGSTKDKALSVAEARGKAGLTDVWVYGFIVGGDLSSSKCSFEAPFTSKTNIVLATRASCTDKDDCLSVQLNKGAVRDALNLVDNEDLLGTKVFIYGDIVQSYYGIPGIQSISDWSF